MLQLSHPTKGDAFDFSTHFHNPFESYPSRKPFPSANLNPAVSTLPCPFESLTSYPGQPLTIVLPCPLIVRAHIRPASAPPHLCILRDLCVEIPPSLVCLHRASLGIPTPRLYAFSEASVPKSFEISTLKTLSFRTIIDSKSFRMNTYEKGAFSCHVSPFRMNTCKSVSKQRTLTTFRMNTYEKQGEGGPVIVN